MIRIYNKLKSDNLNPFFAGQHVGVCSKHFVVVLKSSQLSFGNNRVGQQIVDIVICSPVSSYIAMEKYKKKVIDSLKELDFLRKTGYESPIITEDDKKMYSHNVEYTMLKQLEG